MAVDAEPDAERHVGGELDEERSPVPVEDVEVVLVYRHCSPVEVEAGDGAILTAVGFGAEGLVVLLGNTDEHHTLSATVAGEVPLRDVVLALTPLKLDH